MDCCRKEKFREYEDILEDLANLFGKKDLENLDAADFKDRASEILKLVTRAKAALFVNLSNKVWFSVTLGKGKNDYIR